MSTLAYDYRAVDKSGIRRSGVARAASEVEAYRQVRAMGLTPVSIRLAKGEQRKRGRGGRRATVKSVAHFTSQLGVLIAARVPLADALASIAEQEPDRRLAGVIRDVASRIESGEPLADALGNHRAMFGDVYIETLRAAEKTGNMTKVLEHLSDMLERAEETRRQVVGALTYPLIVLAVLLMGASFLVGFVVPKFARIFNERHVDLPLVTRMLQAIGASVQGYWYAYLAAIVAGSWTLVRMWRSPGGRSRLETALHHVPYVSSILRGQALSRWSHVLSVSLSSGLGLIAALELAGKACGRPRLDADTRKLVEQVKRGGKLTEGMAACGYLTPFTRRMLTAGETSGELSRMCGVVGRHYDRETHHLTKNLGTAIEPVMVVGIAGLVLVVALAIFLPMWNMVNLLK